MSSKNRPRRRSTAKAQNNEGKKVVPVAVKSPPNTTKKLNVNGAAAQKSPPIKSNASKADVNAPSATSPKAISVQIPTGTAAGNKTANPTRKMSYADAVLSPETARPTVATAVTTTQTVVNEHLVSSPVDDMSVIGEATERKPKVTVSKDKEKDKDIHKALTEQMKLVISKAARQHVFNNLPIRLLTFKEDGTSIKLIEREDILHSINSELRDYFQKNTTKIVDLARQPEHAIVAKLKEEIILPYTRYAVLSHCWLHDNPGNSEYTYDMWKPTQSFKGSGAGYDKLLQFCRISANFHQVKYGWMDTICINKESSSELDESIRSMYKWYREAYVCITYLADTKTLQDMRTDTWFTRGWTLQELLAPHRTKFYNSDWRILDKKMLNDKKNGVFVEVIKSVMEAITVENLCPTQGPGDRRHPGLSIPQIMKWAAKRTVTREEDMAYSLMGIFDVSFSIAYGEGPERAFFRLCREILDSPTKDVLDLMNWGSGDNFQFTDTRVHASTIIPTGPGAYRYGANSSIPWHRLTQPVILTHLGLQLPVLMIPAISTPNPKATFKPSGNFYGYVTINTKQHPPYYNLFDRDIKDESKTLNRTLMTFGVLNFTEHDDTIDLPYNLYCFSVCFLYSGKDKTAAIEPRDLKRVHTAQGIFFRLKDQPKNKPAEKPLRQIPKKALRDHSMGLLTLYL